MRRRRSNQQSVREILLGASPSLLSSDVATLFLPERIERQLRADGVQLVSHLADRSDPDFLSIEGIARRSLRDIRQCVQAAIDRGFAIGESGIQRTFSDVDSLSLEALVDRFNSEDICKPIDELDLPFRCSKRLASMEVTLLGHLARYRCEELLAVDGFGRKYLRELEEALRDLLRGRGEAVVVPPVRDERESKPDDARPLCLDKAEDVQTAGRQELFGDDLSKALDAALEALDARTSYVLRHRMGYRVSARTLEELGQEMSVSRERIRQLQGRALGWLQAQSGVADALARSMEEIMGSRTEPLFAAALPAEHKYYRHMRNAEQVVPFLLDQLCPNTYFALSLSNVVVLSRMSDSDWAACKSQARGFIAASVERRLHRDVVWAGINSLVSEKAPELCEELWLWVQTFAHFAGPDGDKKLVAYGRGVEQMVVAVLEDEDAPIHYSDIACRIAERYGEQEIRRVANAAADVALLLDRGVYGTERHLPLTRKEAQYVASLCEALVAESSMQHRQWHGRDFVEELSPTEPLVAQLNAYEVCAVLKIHSNLHYVGRQVWVAAKQGRGGVHMRLDIRNAIEAIVEEEGAPLAASEIYKRVSAVRGIGHFQIHPRGSLIKVGPSVWGIAGRDVPWYITDREVVLAVLLQSLVARGSALHITEIAEHVVPAVGFAVDPWHVYGVAQVDPRFKSFSGDLVGLSDWLISGRQTVPNAVEQLRSENRYWSLVEIQGAVERKVERQVAAESLRWVLRNSGASFDQARGLWDLRVDARPAEEDCEAQLQ